MNVAWVLSLPEGARAVRVGDDSIIFEGAYERLQLRRLTRSLQSALELLVSPGDTLRQMAEVVAEGGISGEFARFTYYLRRLAERGMLRIAAYSENQRLATLEPTSKMFELVDNYVPGGRYVLSRFTYLHRVADELVLESPLSASRVWIEDHRIADALFHMTAPITPAVLQSHIPNLSADAIDGILSLLTTARMLTQVRDDNITEEDEHTGLQMWEFHDLLFHARSRIGRHNAPIGGVFPWAGILEPLPAIPRIDSKDPVSLCRPDLVEIEQQDQPFARVVEQRRSVREYGENTISVPQLGEFLYRVARVKERVVCDFALPAASISMELISRPYPSAGAIYELEIYVAVQRCDGLPIGMYHYNGRDHQLNPISVQKQHIEELWKGAADCAGIQAAQIQVLLILSARFPRINWKYSSLAYSAILKNVGVLYESMYLTATAMNLAPCALGIGDSDIFAKAIGSDYYQETSVGEFLVGSCQQSFATIAPNQERIPSKQRKI